MKKLIIPALKRFQILLLAVSVFVVLTVVFIPAFQKKQSLVFKQKDLQSEITGVKDEIESLKKRELAIRQDPLYLEKLAREKLGYSRPNEIIYHFD